MSYRSVSDQLIISVLHVDNYEQELKRVGTADNYVAIEGEPEGFEHIDRRYPQSQTPSKYSCRRDNFNAGL